MMRSRRLSARSSLAGAGGRTRGPTSPSSTSGPGDTKEAAAIWAGLKASDPDDVWLYNAAGLSYNEIGEHELAVAWLGEGIELAMRTEDPEGIVPSSQTSSQEPRRARS